MSVKTLKRFTKVLLVTCNIIVAVFLFIGCYGSEFDAEKYWYTGLFTLTTFYILLLLGVFAIFWIFVKKTLVFISITAVILCWSKLKEVIPFHFGHNFVIAKKPARIRVMSWNVEHFDILEHRSHPERKQEMIAMINEYEPDIACFQEMVASDRFPAAINYLPDFVSKLNMYDYHYAYNPKLDFDNKHHFGIIIFSKYPIVNKETIAYAPKDYNSIFQYIDILKGRDTIRIFNIHLQSLKFSNNNLKYIETPSINDETDIQESKSVIAKLRIGFLKRKKQSERIRKAIDESPYPAIVCGDFNDVPNSYAYNFIGKGMNNAFAEKGTGIGRTFYSISPTLRIDNIFADTRFETEQYVRIKKKLSDHFPIVADLLFQQ